MLPLTALLFMSNFCQLSLTRIFFLQFAFQGTRGVSYQGDIALDDIRLLDGSCPLLRKLKSSMFCALVTLW